MLWAVERVLFGPSREPPRRGDDGSGPGDGGGASLDLRWHEAAALLPLAVFVFWIGLAPATFLGPPAVALRDSTRDSAAAFTERMQPAAAAPGHLTTLP